MAKEIKKPKMLAPVIMTIAAILSIMSLALKIVAAVPALLVLQIFTTGLLSLSAILFWRQYIKQHVDYKFQELEKKIASC